jgi:hypothetical protein
MQCDHGGDFSLTFLYIVLWKPKVPFDSLRSVGLGCRDIFHRSPSRVPSIVAEVDGLE